MLLDGQKEAKLDHSRPFRVAGVRETGYLLRISRVLADTSVVVRAQERKDRGTSSLSWQGHSSTDTSATYVRCNPVQPANLPPAATALPALG